MKGNSNESLLQTTTAAHEDIPPSGVQSKLCRDRGIESHQWQIAGYVRLQPVRQLGLADL